MKAKPEITPEEAGYLHLSAKIVIGDALSHAENALKDYIDEKEKAGAMCGYGHSVLRRIAAAKKYAEAL